MLSEFDRIVPKASYASILFIIMICCAFIIRYRISQLLCGAFSGNNFSAKFFSSAASFGASLRSQVRYWYGERGFSLAVSIML